MKIFNIPQYFLYIAQEKEYHPRLFSLWWQKFKRKQQAAGGNKIQSKGQRPELTVKLKLLLSLPVLLLALILVTAPLLGLAFVCALLFLIQVSARLNYYLVLGLLYFNRLLDLTAITILRYAVKKKLSAVDPIIIAVTGSYGKTTVKKIMDHVLSTKFVVQSTPKSFNNLKSIMRFVLTALDRRCQVLIIEAGAYRQGEIADITALFQPDIAVVTGISDQHLEYFGSRENLFAAKAEIFDYLKADGLAIVNSSNKQFLQSIKLVNLARSAVSGPLTMVKYNFAAKRWGLNLQGFSQDQIQAQWLDETGQKQAFTTRFLGYKSLENVLPAIIAAQHLDIRSQDIRTALQYLAPVNGRFSKQQLKSGAILLDDSYNISQGSVKEGWQIMNLIAPEREKVIVLSGIPELGGLSQEVNTKLGRYLAAKFDKIVLYKSHLSQWLQAGMSKQAKQKLTTITSHADLENYLSFMTNRQQIILLEPLLPRHYL
jgi:UDP-N-acetylmuramoyl-tripeptide--D-alanyl-D-alanine ligase